MKNASRTKVREATDRGSTLFYHSRRPVDAGQTEGFHIPRAPGRTFTAPAAGALAAGDAPSLFFGSAVTLPDQHAIPFTLCILTGFERGVKRQLHAGISRPCALRLDSAPASPYRICRNVETVPPVNRRLTKFQWLSLAKRPPFRYDGTKEKEGILHGIEGPYRCRPQSGGIDPRAAGRAAGQAVSKWESGQTTPDAATIAALCEKLHVSADYVLLGKEPGEGQTAAYEPPDTCPCCGRKVSGSICPECGYQLPNHPPRGPQYAVVATRPGFVQSTESSAQLVKYCGFTQEDANNAIAHYVNNQSRILLQRGLVDSAAQYIAAHLDQDFFCPQIVVDCGESEEALLYKPKAFETPSPVKSQEGIGFWGVVCAVIVALLILSFF